MFFNRFMALFSALVLCCFLCVPAFAVDEVGIGDSVPVAVETVPDDKQVVVNVVMPAASETASDSSVDGEASSPAALTNVSGSAVYSTYSLDNTEVPVEASLPGVLVALFGEYQPRTQTVTEYLADGTEVTYQQYVDGLAGLDWTWIASVVLFAMSLYCVLRMIGGCLRWI